MEGNRKPNELDQKAHSAACVSANTDLSVGRLGALSCDRATRVAKLGLSCWQRRRAAAPARTATAAAHAGSQGVPWEPGIGWLPLRPQGPRASERHAWKQKTEMYTLWPKKYVLYDTTESLGIEIHRKREENMWEWVPRQQPAFVDTQTPPYLWPPAHESNMFL